MATPDSEQAERDLDARIRRYVHATRPSRQHVLEEYARLEGRLTAEAPLRRRRRSRKWVQLLAAAALLTSGAGAAWHAGVFSAQPEVQPAPPSQSASSPRVERPEGPRQVVIPMDDPAEELPAEEIAAEPTVAQLNAAKSAPKPTAKPEVPDTRAELLGIAEARSALRTGDSEKALRLLNAHQSQFPGSAFAEERAGLRAVAACRLGRGDALGRSFLKRFPHAPLSGVVQSACAIDEERQ